MISKELKIKIIITVVILGLLMLLVALSKQLIIVSIQSGIENVR